MIDSAAVELNREICRTARLSRDARFDGKFFIAVRTTRIFCRPVCPARSPKEENIDYYPSAAAALQAGFRPCLRCRPESWGTAAWDGTSTTVARALRLIHEGALDSWDGDGKDSNVDALAERLGIGSRHLRRLFWQHLGATPIAVAQAQRLLSAKKLIDETTLPLDYASPSPPAMAAFADSMPPFEPRMDAARASCGADRSQERRARRIPVPARCNCAFGRRTTTTLCFSFSPSARLPASNTFMATSTAEPLCWTASPAGWK